MDHRPDITAVERAARELVERHGRNAVEFAQGRVRATARDSGGIHDAAWLLLSAVERLLQ